MTINLSDGGVLTQIWVKDGDMQRQIKEVHTKIDGKIWSNSSPIDAGTHEMVVGTSSGAYGFAEGVFGSLTPSSIEGFPVQYLQEAADILRLGTPGDTKIWDANNISILGNWPGAQTIQLTWNSGISSYVSPVYPELNNWLASKVGETIHLNIVSDATPLSELVEAMLAGTTGFVFDTQDHTTMWQDSAGTIPVIDLDQPVGRFASKFGTASPLFVVQPVDDNRPILTLVGSNALVFDGLGDILERASGAPPVTSVIQAAAVIVSGYLNAGVNGQLFVVGDNVSRRITSTTATSRFASIGTDIGGSTEHVITDPVAPATQDGVKTAIWDFAGSTGVTLRVDGVQTHNAPLPFTAGPTPTKTVMRTSLGQNNRASTIRRCAYVPFLPTAEQLAILEAWAGGTT